MFGVEYLIGFINIAVRFGISFVWAIVITPTWNRLAPIYFDFVPEQYMHFKFWHVVFLSMLVAFIGSLIQDLVPTIAKVEQNNGKEN